MSYQMNSKFSLLLANYLASFLKLKSPFLPQKKVFTCCWTIKQKLNTLES
jgi:hypothetical protein